MKNYRFSIAIEKDENGYFAFCPELQGCHALDTLRWVKKLTPSPSTALKIASLFHDIDRVVIPKVGGGFKGDRKGPKYEKYKKDHAKRSANYICPILIKKGINPELVKRVNFLILHHDDKSSEIKELKDKELEILVATDSSSFFTSTALRLYTLENRERLEDKIRFMIKKMPISLRNLLAKYHFQNPILENLKEKVLKEIELQKIKRKKIVDVIIEKNGKILMLKRNFWPKNKLDLIGGFVNKRESLQAAAKREAKEETGLTIKIIKKLGTFDYFDREQKRATVFIGKIIGGKLKKSKEGKSLWVKLEQVTPDKLAFPQLHIRVINQYKNLKQF